MGTTYDDLNERNTAFIAEQRLFFVGTAMSDGRVNVSPKGMDSLRVLSPNRVVWLNVTGSGNETAAHMLENPRMTIMFAAFEGAPMILRLYGTATAVHPTDAGWSELIAHFDEAIPGSRQIFDLSIDLVQKSCGKAVPYFDFAGERDDLREWAINKGDDGLQTYWQKKNAESLDGRDTGMAARVS